MNDQVGAPVPTPPLDRHRLAALDHLWAKPSTRLALAILGGAILLMVVTAPLDLYGQLLFAVCAGIAVFAMRRIPGRMVTIAMVLISIVVSLRYMYWRVTSTLGFTEWIDVLFGYGLLLAEI